MPETDSVREQMPAETAGLACCLLAVPEVSRVMLGIQTYQGTKVAVERLLSFVDSWRETVITINSTPPPANRLE